MVYSVPHITREQALALRTRLRRRARELVREIEAGRRSGALEQESFDPVGIEEAAVEATQIDRDTVELHAIEAALARMERGIYGICRDCAAPLPWVRLDAMPHASRCTHCEEAHERGRAKPATL